MSSNQMTMFEDAPAPGQAPAPVANPLGLARYMVHRDKIKPALIEHGLYGYPDLICNPGGRLKEWKGAAASPEAHRICWPAHYVVAFRGDSVVPTIRVFVYEDQVGNPAVHKALDAMKQFGNVEVEYDNDSPLPYFRRNQPRFDDETIITL
jgi:hypothetical protein